MNDWQEDYDECEVWIYFSNEKEDNDYAGTIIVPKGKDVESLIFTRNSETFKLIRS